jgi:putative tryptophan/tyrosine transport system substrate-binding protein
MRRRDALVGLGTVPALLTATDRLAGQEAPKRFRLGIVSGNPRTTRFWVGFDQRLRELGHGEGQNPVVDFIDTRGRPETFLEGAHELVRRNVDAIVASGPEASLKSALAATHETPIVMVAVDYDPLALGYVNSLARPTGNVTGLFFQEIELAVKRVELLKQTLPALQTATVFWRFVSGWCATSRALAKT